MRIEEGLYYTKEHEWIRVEGKTAWVGVTDYAQDQLGDIVYVELPEEDDEVEKNDAIAALESVKAASDVYAPLTGIVTEVNEALEDEPGLINSDAYDAWIFKGKLTMRGVETYYLQKNTKSF